MTRIVAVDPGKRMSGVARFEDERLVDLKLLDRELYGSSIFSSVQQAVIECPQIYPGAQAKNPDDLVDVALAAGEVMGALAMLNPGLAMVYATPAQWKGQVQKPIHHWRLWAALDPDERELITRLAKCSVEDVEQRINSARHALAVGKTPAYGWKAHNAFDAIGIGLWHLGRTNRGGTLPT